MNWLLRSIALCLGVVLLSHVQGDGLGDLDIADARPIQMEFTPSQEQAMSNSKPQEFQAEVNRLMEIIINSLYKTRDIFLRELISNSVDALDKIRYQSLTGKSQLGSVPNLDIRVQVDPQAHTITIVDTGIGMTAAELAKNLGTIAHSGTAYFLDAFTKGTETGENPLHLIGQFGVGFYSAFLVADEVVVVSKSNNDPDQYVWKSKADGQFTISKDPRGNTLGRGTAVILKIKDDAKEFLNNEKIESVIQRYSEFMQYPIYSYATRKEEIETESDDKDASAENEELSTSDEDVDGPGKKKKTVEKVTNYWKRLNSNKPIWSRRPNEVTAEEYQSFYKAFTKDTEPPLAHTHFRAEGEIEFDSILYIPEKVPPAFYDNYHNVKSKLKLYVRRVLVADEFEDIVPRYLNFVKGLVDSNDLPLNVNREDLQKNKIMGLISRKLTRKVLDMLRNLARGGDGSANDEDEEEGEGAEKKEAQSVEPKSDEKYLKFWNEFGKALKLGVLEDNRNKKRIIELLRFISTRSPDKPVSLRSYVDNMKPGQKFIYYIAAGSVDEAENSPFLERFRNKGYEVLYFTDNLDEFMNLQDYDDIPLQAISKENVELDGQKMKDFLKEKEEEFSALKTWLKDVYGSKISKVQISSTLEATPMAIATATYGTSARMEKIGKAQAFGSQQMYPVRATKVLQINYRHPIIVEMKNRVQDSDDTEQLKDLARLLLDMALVKSGFEIEPDEQTEFGQRIARIVQKGLNLANDAKLEPEPAFASETDAVPSETVDEEYEEDEEDINKEEL